VNITIAKKSFTFPSFAAVKRAELKLPLHEPPMKIYRIAAQLLLFAIDLDAQTFAHYSLSLAGAQNYFSCMRQLQYEERTLDQNHLTLKISAKKANPVTAVMTT
jgi:hypothetical protein